MVAAACGGSSKSSSSSGGGGGGSSSAIPNQIYSDNNSGTPKTGGTLTMLGVGDVDNALDPNYAYYTVDFQAERMYERNLYINPAVHGQTFSLVPDLATAFPKVTENGLLYQLTIRKGATWDTSPPRQVTAADAVLGVKRSCNPTAPFSGQADFSDVLEGYAAYCSAFANISATDATKQADFINSHNITGVYVDPNDKTGLTVDYKLMKPANYFTGVLSLGAFNPVPKEYLDCAQTVGKSCLPISNTLGQYIVSQHLSDGPYVVASYKPNVSIVFKRNPNWNASSDPVRKAYVDEIDVSETGNQQQITQEILTNTPSADMMWDTHVAPSAVPGLVTSKNPGLSLQTEANDNPWIVYNTISKNNCGALSKVAVRQALNQSLSRAELVQNGGGPLIEVPQTHVITAGTNGNSPDFDPYPYDPTKAASVLKTAGCNNGPLTLKYLYRPASIAASKDFQTVQNLMQKVGVTVTGVTATNADFYAKDLSPGTLAKSSGWDLAEPGWGPDWYPTGTKSMFLPILDGRHLPPNSSNYGFFDDPKATALYDQALAAPTDAEATNLWHQADMEVMSQAPLFPIANPNEAQLHNNRVHNCIYIAVQQNCDATNIWLS
jgi:peptide/nickel transport system substrate-binding protein